MARLFPFLYAIEGSIRWFHGPYIGGRWLFPKRISESERQTLFVVVYEPKPLAVKAVFLLKCMFDVLTTVSSVVQVLVNTLAPIW